MRAAITGGAGFVGRHLAEHLETAGDNVVALGPEVDVTDPDAILTAIEAARPDAVYHLAGVSHVGDSWDAPARVFRVNAEGTLNTLRACAAASVDRVLVVGSADEYGIVTEADLPLTESAPLRPVTPYAASKVAAEFLTLQAFLGDGLGAIAVRAFNHTGPGQSDRFVVPAIASRIAAAEKTGDRRLPLGSLDAVRDFTDVRDVVRAYRLLVERGQPGEVYNVCSGRGVSVGEMVATMVAATGAQLEVVIDPGLVRPIEIPRLVGDAGRLRDATGWEPQIPLDQTLRDVLASARAEVAR